MNKNQKFSRKVNLDSNYFAFFGGSATLPFRIPRDLRVSLLKFGYNFGI